MSYLKKIYISGLVFLFPVITHAVAAPRDFKGFVDILTGLIQTLILIVFALTFLAFMWGVLKSWIFHGGDADSVADGKNVVVVGVIALTIMSAIWGILYMLRSSLFG